MNNTFYCALTGLTVNKKNLILWKKEISKKSIIDKIPKILFDYGKSVKKEDEEFFEKEDYIDKVQSLITKKIEKEGLKEGLKEGHRKSFEENFKEGLRLFQGTILNTIPEESLEEVSEEIFKELIQEFIEEVQKNNHEKSSQYQLLSVPDDNAEHFMKKRLIKYNTISQFMKNLKNNSLMIPYENKYMIYTDDTNIKILLYNQIGSESVYGINFKCKFIQYFEGGDYIEKSEFFVCKIQICKTDTEIEIKILDFLTKQIITKGIPHLPLLYKNIKCPIQGNKELLPELLKNSKNKSYYVTFNELAEGDLKSLLNNEELTAEIWINAIEQIYMSIAIFHSFGLWHQDCHYGNFLYHKIPAGGWFHYTINDNEYYIPNLGYYWVIWDFGIVTKLYNKFTYLEDYNLLTLFLRKNDDIKTRDPSFFDRYELEKVKYVDKKGEKKEKKQYRKWGYLSDKINIPDPIESIVDKLYRLSGGYNRNYISKLCNISEDIFFKKIVEDKILYDHIYDGGKILTNAKIKLASYKHSKESRITPDDLDECFEIKKKGK